jgi:purine-binding chemotaxis protein CheW
MTNGSKRLDWEGVRARLQRIQESLERVNLRSEEDTARLFNERAQRLAQPPANVSDARIGNAALLMVFRLGDERYAVPLSDVAEVIREAKVTPIPGAHRSIAGVIQVRGEIRPVYALPHELGRSESAEGSRGGIILIGNAGQQFGIRVDEVQEIRAVSAERSLETSASFAPSPAAPLPRVAWVTDDLVSVLNVEAIDKDGEWET